MEEDQKIETAWKIIIPNNGVTKRGLKGAASIFGPITLVRVDGTVAGVVTADTPEEEFDLTFAG